MKFLCESVAPGVSQWILPVILLVLVIGIFVLNYFRSKKNQENMKTMIDSLKVGDNVKTYSGIYGKIIEIIDTTDGKMVVLETGSEKNKGIFSIDINAVFGIDAKEPAFYDQEGNLIVSENKKEEEKIETKTIKKDDIEKDKDEKPVKKTSVKKTEKKVKAEKASSNKKD